MIQIQKYIKENRRNIKKDLRKNIIVPFQARLHQVQRTIQVSSFFLKKHIFNKKFFAALSLVLFCLMSFKDFAWANPTQPAASVNASATASADTTSTTISGIVDILNLLIAILTFIISPLIMLVGWLLSPDWTFGEIFNLRGVFQDLWILVSNFVYVIFGLMIVVIAFMNIFGGGKGEFAIRQALPKLILGILVVPFTWFIVSMILSVVNILTASVIQLPMDTILRVDNGSNSFLTNPTIPKEVVYDNTINENSDEDYGNGVTNRVADDGVTTTDTGAYVGNGNFYTSNCDPKTNSKYKQDCISIQDLLTGPKGGAYNMLSVYAYGIFKIHQYKTIDISEIKGIKAIGDIAKKLSFGLIFFIMFGILVVAIAFALFTRVMWLWVYIIFSPVFALYIFLKGRGGKLEKDIEKHFTISKFISLALVPVYVSAALSFGLMFLSATMNVSSNGNEGTILDSASVKIQNNTAQGQTFTFGEGQTAMTFSTIGVLTKSTEDTVQGVLGLGKGIISTIIINVLALAILWMAVMAALGANEITGAAVKPISEFGASVGKLAMESPKYIPITLPGMKDANNKPIKMSMGGMSSLGSNIETHFSGKAREQGTKFAESFLGNSPLSEATDKLAKALDQTRELTKEKFQGAGEIYSGAKGDMSVIMNNPRSIKELSRLQADLAEHGKTIDKVFVKGLNLNDKNDLAKLFRALDREGDSNLALGGVMSIDSKVGDYKNYTANDSLNDYGKTGAVKELNIYNPTATTALDGTNLKVVVNGSKKDSTPAKPKTIIFNKADFDGLTDAESKKAKIKEHLDKEKIDSTDEGVIDVIYKSVIDNLK